MIDFTKSTNAFEDSYIVPPNSFEQRKPFILIGIQFCDENKKKLKDFIPKGFTENSKEFSKNKFKILVK